MDFTNYLTMRSSNMAAMKAATVNLSALTGSTLNITTSITAPTAFYSTLSGSTITVSTLTGSSLFGSTMFASSIRTSFLTLSTLMVSSINNNVPGTGSLSMLTVSSLITASTITASSINVTTGGITASSITSATGMLTVGCSTISVGNRLFGIADNSPSGNFWTGLRGSGTEASRLGIAIVGNQTTGAVDSVVFKTGGGSKVVTLTSTGNSTHVAGDSSYILYGPNSTGSAYLAVGATTDKGAVKTAQAISTNGNLHLDAGNNNSIYYGYYATSRSTANTHEFYGQVNLRNSDFIKFGNTATSYMGIVGGTSGNSPYLAFYYGGSRRCFIGNATATNFDIWAENGNQITLGTATLDRVVIDTAGNVKILGRECIATNLGYGQFRALSYANGFFIRNDGSNTYFLLTAANDPYGVWNGLRPFRVNNASGMVYIENGLVISNISWQSNQLARALCINSDNVTIAKTQAITKEMVRSNAVAWTGGVNMTYAFYKANVYVSVTISGMCSGWTGGATFVYPTIRLYSQSAGTYTYYETRSYTNNGGNHVILPIDWNIPHANIPNTGWYDLYFYSGGGLFNDSGDRLQLNVTILPGSDF